MMHALVSSLTPSRSAFVLAVLTVACGRSPSPVDQPVEFPVDTLAAVDSIGIMIGDSNYMFGSIADFTPVPGGGVAVLDRITEKVSFYDGEGLFTRSFGGHGEAPGEFQWPVALEVLPSGVTLVLEGASGKVNVFDPQGAFVTSWQMEGMGIYPMQVQAFDDSSFVSHNFSMLMDGEGLSIRFSLWRYDALTGEVLSDFMTWDAPSSASTDFTDAYFVYTADGEGRLYLSRAASPTWMIEVFGAEAEPLDTLILFQERPRLAVESDSQSVPGAPSINYVYQDEDAGNMVSGTTNRPAFHPFVSEIEIGSGGDLWVRQGGLPSTEWDVVTPSGEPVGRFRTALGDTASYISIAASEEGIYAMDLMTEDYQRLYMMELQ
jgi:hypothetical protein